MYAAEQIIAAGTQEIYKEVYSVHVMYGFSISITWTNERKLNFRWLLYFRSGKVEGEN